jgi:hypothetical protein
MIEIDDLVDGLINYLPRTVDDGYYSNTGGFYSGSPAIFASEFLGVQFFISKSSITCNDDLRKYALSDGIYHYRHAIDTEGSKFVKPMCSIIGIALREYLFALMIRSPSIARLVRGLENGYRKSLDTEFVFYKISMQIVKDVNVHRRNSHKVFTDNIDKYAKRFEKLKK